MTERGIERSFTTADQIVKMNRATIEQRDEKVWDATEIAKLDIDGLKQRMEASGSGRYFLHAFPQVSLENGHITNGIGGDALLGGFKQSRDYGRAINFTAEHGSEHATQFYLGLGGGIGGGVLYPAEVLLQNYAFLNLPYLEDLRATSGEWRVFGPINNPTSQLHVIPLNLGVCFFRKEGEGKVREIISAMPEKDRPNKVIFYEGSYNDGLRDFLSRMPAPRGLPRISRPLEIIDTEESTPIFGTAETKRRWRGKNIGTPSDA